MEKKYLILARHYSTNGTCCWWRANKAGYTDDVNQAGRYTEEEARRIETNQAGRGGRIDIAVPEDAIKPELIVHVIRDEHAHDVFKAFQKPEK